MAYDPNFPPDHQPLNAAPFRTQFQGLKEISDGKATAIPQITPLSYPTDVQPQDPMTADLVAKVNELIAGLKA